jgi:hypothetical protein
MAVQNQQFPTLLDVATRSDPKGKIAKIVEALTIDTPLLQDMPWVEANGPDGHLITTRTALPSLTWRRYNEGTVPSKSKTAQVTETTGILDGLSKVDVALAKRNGNEAAFRQSEDLAFMAAYNRSLEDAFFYASQKANPERVTGLSPRLDALSGIPYGSQIIQHATGVVGSDITSIWLVGWGPRKVYGIYPPGTVAGLQVNDMGIQLETEAGTTNQLPMYRTYFSWQCGFAVEDARYLVRGANIKTSTLAGSGATTLIQMMIKMTEQIQSLNDCMPVFYCNRFVRSILRQQAVGNIVNSTLQYDMVGGKPMMSFAGIPIHRSDALINAETALA